MQILSDIHTHTTYSHGKGTIRENVLAAIDKGLKEVAICDHGIAHMFFNIKNLREYLQAINEIKEEFKDKIKVLSGVELNIVSLDGEVDLPFEFCRSFDILLLGYHKMVKYKDIRSFLHFMFKINTKKAVRQNTQAYINAIEKYEIDVITHLGYGLKVDKAEIAKAAAKHNTALEINSKHNEFSKSDLMECAKTGVKFALGSDAHSTDRIGCIENSVLKAQDAGITDEIIIHQYAK